jgi:cytochrome c oxidase subunit 2
MLFRDVFEQIFTLQTLIAGGVFVLVVGVLVVVVARNRARRREHLPFAARENNALEIGVSVLLAGAAAALVWVSLSANARLGGGTGVAEATEGRPAAQISVTAFRWCWDFAYQGAAPVRVTGSCDRPEDRPVVVVPAGQPVDFALTSRDVVHSFWVPEFGIKRDANPDHVNELRMTFPEGQWLGRCSEYCGTYHLDMDFYVRAVPPDQYAQWLQSGGTSA